MIVCCPGYIEMRGQQNMKHMNTVWANCRDFGFVATIELKMVKQAYSYRQNNGLYAILNGL